MTDRYPELDPCCVDDLIVDQDEIIKSLHPVFEVLMTNSMGLARAVDQLVVRRDADSLVELCHAVFKSLPLKDEKGDLHPMISTREQLERYMSGDYLGYGDCKLSTVLTAYICNVVAGLPITISVKNYSGHPVLFVGIDDEAYKVSFLHETVTIKAFKGEDPFQLTAEQKYDPNFLDADFPNDKLILFWKVSEAIFLLDCVNILRRCVVNYIIDPLMYTEVFENVVEKLKNSGIYHNSIIFYWQGEIERVASVIKYHQFTKSSEQIRKVIIESLRF